MLYKTINIWPVFKIVLLFTFFSTIIPQRSYCQLIGQFTQYYANELVINPAYAGADDALSVTAVHRSQWTGLEGAPTTQTISIHSLTKNDHVGLGLAVINDKIGIHKNLTAMNSYSYRINLNKDAYLALGIQAGFSYRGADYESLYAQVQDPNDPYLATGISQFKFEFGSGLYFKSPRFRAGLSAPKMLTGRTNLNDSLSIELNRSQYFLFIRYQYPISANVDLHPGMLVKYIPGSPISWNLTLAANIKKVLLVGVSYRFSESIGGILQINVTPQLKFGYSYDFVISPVSILSNNSHELMLSYLFNFTTYKIKNVR